MTDQFWIILAGSLVALMGITGLSNKTRRNAWLLRLLGPTGNRLLYIVLGLAFVMYGVFFL
jgi:hypothetical protein